MTSRAPIIAALAAAALLASVYPARAGKQVVALFPPENLGGAQTAAYVPMLTAALAEKLSDRFAVQTVKGEPASDVAGIRERARSLGAMYVIKGSLARIGKGLSLDLEIAPTEDPRKGRVVVVSAIEGTGAQGGELPPGYRRLAVEAAARLKYIFFGDEVVGEGAARKKIPKPLGELVRSRSIPGDVVSAAYGDVDGDGKKEVVAAYGDSLVVYSVTGDDLVEKAKIHGTGSGYVHVDVIAGAGKGGARIVATRYQDGSVASELFAYEGKAYKAVASGLPYFMRAAALGSEGTILLGQDADPATVFGGPVYRLATDAAGAPGERGSALPLPAGTGIYDFVPVRNGQALRYVVLGETGRLRLLDEGGRLLKEAFDAVAASDAALEAAIGGSPDSPAARKERRSLAPRLFAADLNGDGTDEVVVFNNLSTAGWFFQGILIRTGAEGLCFAQDGDALRLAWRTGQVDAPAGDAFLVSSADGKLERIGIAARRTGRILSGYGEWSLLWMK